MIALRWAKGCWIYRPVHRILWVLYPALVWHQLSVFSHLIFHPSLFRFNPLYILWLFFRWLVHLSSMVSVIHLAMPYLDWPSYYGEWLTHYVWFHYLLSFNVTHHFNLLSKVALENYKRGGRCRGQLLLSLQSRAWIIQSQCAWCYARERFVSFVFGWNNRSAIQNDAFPSTHFSGYLCPTYRSLVCTCAGYTWASLGGLSSGSKNWRCWKCSK